MSFVLDTNILLKNSDIIRNYLEKANVIIPSAVLEELDGLKKSDDNGYNARSAIRVLKELKKDIIFEAKDVYHGMPTEWDVDKRDNKIVMSAKENNSTLVTNDFNVNIKAESLGIEVEELDNDFTNDEIYNGYIRLSGNTDFINNIFENIESGINEYNLVVNQYLIIENTDLDDTFEFRYDGENLVNLKLPSSKVIKGLNSEQRCALDMLNNPDIKICAILGGYGSGKTFLSLRMALHNVREKGLYSKVLAVREILGDGKEAGFLPGDLHTKVAGFFKPIEHSLDGGEQELYNLIVNGILEENIPYYLQGTTYNDTLIWVDESQLLTKKQIKMIGTRVGNNGAITFCGDYKQAIKNDTVSNPLISMCNELRGEKSFGCIALNEDVRSSVSKTFAKLW